MKKIIILLTFFLFFISCYDDNSESDITIIGDSMAEGVSIYGVENWYENLNSTDINNEGKAGAPIQYFYDKVMFRSYKTVILFVGFNNIKHGNETIEQIKEKYYILIKSIHADRIILIGVPYMQHEKSDLWYPEGSNIRNEKIMEYNNFISSLGYEFIDTSDLETVDGIHPVYEKIIERLNYLI